MNIYIYKYYELKCYKNKHICKLLNDYYCEQLLNRLNEFVYSFIANQPWSRIRLMNTKRAKNKLFIDIGTSVWVIINYTIVCLPTYKKVIYDLYHPKNYRLSRNPTPINITKCIDIFLKLKIFNLIKTGRPITLTKDNHWTIIPTTSIIKLIKLNVSHTEKENYDVKYLHNGKLFVCLVFATQNSVFYPTAQKKSNYVFFFIKKVSRTHHQPDIRQKSCFS